MEFGRKKGTKFLFSKINGILEQGSDDSYTTK
jgi:hypothetical protein